MADKKFWDDWKAIFANNLGVLCADCAGKLAGPVNAGREKSGYVQFKDRADGSPGVWTKVFVGQADLDKKYGWGLRWAAGRK